MGEKWGNMLKKAWFLPKFLAINLNMASLTCSRYFFVLDASIYGLKYTCGCHKFQNEGSECRIQWKMTEILLFEKKVAVAIIKGKKLHI